MTPRKATRIKEIEDEHGLPIEQVFKDYSKLYSWQFTCKLTGCGKQTFSEYKYLFTWNKQPRREVCSWVGKSNANRAKLYEGKTLKQLSEVSGIHPNTLYHRIERLNWPVGDAITIKPAARGDISRIPKDKRNRGYKLNFASYKNV